MELLLPIDIRKPEQLIEHTDKIMLIGSCFTEHMSNRLLQSKFRIDSNPNGILFNPLSVTASLQNMIQNKIVAEHELFYLNELYHSWEHHSDFSNIQANAVVEAINNRVAYGHQFLKDAEWLIITMGSAYQYYLKEGLESPLSVANCHRAPGTWFEKRLLEIDFMVNAIATVIESLQSFNPKLQIIFTVSPVRHIRDGIIQNNRSKGRLLEAVHQMVDRFEHCHYFPAYEIAMDVLRDYRFFDIDMVHPNYACTQYIWEQFANHYFSEACLVTAKTFKEITTAYQHRTRFPETEAHQNFMIKYAQKVQLLSQQYPYVDFIQEQNYFGK